MGYEMLVFPTAEHLSSLNGLTPQSNKITTNEIKTIRRTSVFQAITRLMYKRFGGYKRFSSFHLSVCSL